MLGAIGASSLDDVIVFEVSDSRVLTFRDFNRTNSVRYASHDILGKKPLSQYIGPDLDTITLQILLEASLGVNPREEMDKLIYLQRDGTTVSLVIGKGGFGMYRWTIMDLSMTWKSVDNQGFLTSAACDLTLREYL